MEKTQKKIQKNFNVNIIRKCVQKTFFYQHCRKNFAPKNFKNFKGGKYMKTCTNDFLHVPPESIFKKRRFLVS